MRTASSEIIRWVALHVVPQEPQVRGALRRAGVAEADIDDLIQEAYCRFAAMDSIVHVDRPGAYFMQVVKNLWRDQLRRARVVRFEEVTEIAQWLVEAEELGVEAAVAAREQVRMVERLLADLPERCRTIFTLKRIEGLPQREIARRLGVSESIVENDVQKALRRIQHAVRTERFEKEALGVGEPRQTRIPA
ncbi:RNA polymerase sigma-70 factor (ECF subfamily) [Sphingomonas trueperi]|uniref:RNA polymerase sigma factor n=1 Tax=Sphingomonas trueperi TaxID=53317 RepID=UPI003391A521